MSRRKAPAWARWVYKHWQLLSLLGSVGMIFNGVSAMLSLAGMVGFVGIGGTIIIEGWDFS